MFTNRRSIKPLLLAGIAGAAYYAYTKLTDEQKKTFTDSLMKYGKEILGGLFAASKNNTTEDTPAVTEMGN